MGWCVTKYHSHEHRSFTNLCIRGTGVQAGMKYSVYQIKSNLLALHATSILHDCIPTRPFPGTRWMSTLSLTDNLWVLQRNAKECQDPFRKLINFLVQQEGTMTVTTVSQHLSTSSAREGIAHPKEQECKSADCMGSHRVSSELGTLLGDNLGLASEAISLLCSLCPAASWQLWTQVTTSDFSELYWFGLQDLSFHASHQSHTQQAFKSPFHSWLLSCQIRSKVLAKIRDHKLPPL